MALHLGVDHIVLRSRCEPAKQLKYAISFGIISVGQTTYRRCRDTNFARQSRPAQALTASLFIDRKEERPKLKVWRHSPLSVELVQATPARRWAF